MTDAAGVTASITESLRRDILSLAWTPGATVTESAVSLRYGVARPTAKHGIERLVAEGVLTREANRSARVPVLDRGDLVDLYDSRAVVERSALRRLAAIGSVPAAAVAANRSLAAAPDGPFAADDIAFHRALVGGQPSARLARMHAALMGEIELCIGQIDAHSLMSRAEIARQHDGILAAVVAGDPDLAERLVAEHIAAARDRLLAHWDATHADGAH